MSTLNSIREGIEFDAWLASACMPASKARQIIRIFGSPEDFFRAFIRSVPEAVSAVSPRFHQILQKNAGEEYLKHQKALLGKHRISVLRYTDPGYPVSLLHTEDPPAILFYQGELSCLQGKMIAMVGSRAASYGGQKAAHRIAEDLSRCGVRIISGLASGIDASAHQGCLKGGSPTIAVTGCGLDRVYPAGHVTLRDDILRGNGLILSEYAPEEKPAGWHFPVRNRIITGLAEALILMEARIRSGSMTSVHHALEQGKDVFVYPGDPASEQYEGNHQLLREGGIYFTNAHDILEDLRWLDNPPAVRQNIDCPAEKSTTGPEGEAVLRALKRETLSFEQLLAVTKLDPSVLMSTLTILQIVGQIEALPGKLYQLKH